MMNNFIPLIASYFTVFRGYILLCLAVGIVAAIPSIIRRIIDYV